MLLFNHQVLQIPICGNIMNLCIVVWHVVYMKFLFVLWEFMHTRYSLVLHGSKKDFISTFNLTPSCITIKSLSFNQWSDWQLSLQYATCLLSHWAHYHICGAMFDQSSANFLLLILQLLCFRRKTFYSAELSLWAAHIFILLQKPKSLVLKP